jgi:AcrR family transcriptional regulator
VRKTRLPNARGPRTADDAPERRRSEGRTERGRQKRERLLDAARTVFERDGFLHSRISDICAEAGVPQGSFYTYFASKEEAFQTILDGVELDLLTVESLPSDADAIARIRSANLHYFEAIRDNAAILAVIDQVVTFDADARATRDRRQQEFAEALERRTREYQAEGLADRRLDPAIAARALGAMVDAVARSIYLRDDPVDLDVDHVVDQLTMLWGNALGMGPADGAAKSGRP